jgi:hypothetical protein
MAKPRTDSYEYLKYLHEQADLMSQIDGVEYDFNGYNNPEQIEQRLMTGEVPKAESQPVKPSEKPRPRLLGSKLGWIVSGYDI